MGADDDFRILRTLGRGVDSRKSFDVSPAMADLPAPECPVNQTTAAAGLIPTRPEFCRDFAFAPENILALAVVVIADDATMLM